MMARVDARNRLRTGLLIALAVIHAGIGYALTSDLGGKLVKNVVRVMAEIRPSYTD